MISKSRGLAKLAGAIMLFTISGVSASAQKVGSGSGKAELRIGRETYTLGNAYALSMDDIEGTRLEGTPKKSTVLLFTDSPVATDAVGRFFRCAALARGGLLNGVEIRIDTATGKMFGGTIYHGMGSEHSPSLNIIAGGAQTSYQLNDLKTESGFISGAARMEQPEEWRQFNKKGRPLTFQYDIAFRTRLDHQPPMTADLKGPAAVNCAPVTVMLAYDTACRKGDVAAAKRLATPAVTEEWDSLIAKLGEDEFKKAMTQTAMPDARTRLKQITRVVVRGDRATILSKEQGATVAQPMLKKNGVWLVDAS